MKEHAIPQDVTGYRFHIVGNMTLGQFAQLVVGAIAAFLIFQTNLYDLIKWPLIFIVVVAAVVAAFIPIAERPLSHWIKTFFTILYRPTQYAWRRIPHIPEPFLFKPTINTGPVLPVLDLTPTRRRRIQEFLSTTHMASGVDLETKQVETYYEHVFSLFDSQPSMTNSPQKPIQVNKPSLRVRQRSLRANPSTPIILENALSSAANVADPVVTSQDVVQVTSANNVDQDTISLLQDSTSGVMAASRSTDNHNTTPLQRENQPNSSSLSIPAETIPAVAQPQSQPTTLAAPSSAAQGQRTLVTQQPAERNSATLDVTFNKQLPFPSTPTTPNKLVGMVLTQKSELVEGAIIEIRTSSGQVARAVRSNALGQFYITTPLGNGEYVVVVEKANYHFEPQSIGLSGKIVDPIEVRSVE